ncbi:site-specific integrase [Thioalkalivibrio thiocyanodenitrificans]|uniref:site-specific integrase n=1 Tax=Thioalkalivibrio thiocyanodenitrificans TaxID=243063 RepID=UPI00037822E6|nr:site-specific integrase [Thioalkalivibrio thiocyanodenitrificans]
MATITKRGKYYQVRIRRKGFPSLSASFDSAKEARAWTRKQEGDMDRGMFQDPTARSITLAEVLEGYRKDVAPMKKGCESEFSRIRVLLSDRISQFSLANLTSKEVRRFIERRLETVCGSTVNRDLALLSRALRYARADCGIPMPDNPLFGVTRPRNNPHRDRRLRPGEEQRLIAAITADQERDAQGRYVTGTRNPWILPLVLLAIETAMRRSELLAIQWQHVDLERRVIRLITSKNGRGRAIPLSTKAVAILRDLPRSEDGCVFPLTANAIKCAWRRVTRVAGLEDLRFHDLRHEATSRYFEKRLQIMEVASITGHRDLSMLMRYTHLSPNDLAHKLG